MNKTGTLREQFRAEMAALVPWTRFLTRIEPHDPKVGPKGGPPPMPIETMLRVYSLQKRYALSDPMAEGTRYDSQAMRRFAGIELGDDRIPDGPKGPWRQWRQWRRVSQQDTILNFRHLLVRHGLTKAICAEVNGHLADKGISAERETAFGKGGKLRGVMRKAPKGGKLDPIDAENIRIIAVVRAKVAHPFRVLKRQFGHVKTHDRGLAKNRAHLSTLLALGHLLLVRRRLLP